MVKYWVLDKFFNQPSSPRHIEYLVVDKNFRILDTSQGVKALADSPDRVGIANDVRESFPELIGYEDTLIAILSQQRESFALKGIARSLGQASPTLYIDIYALLAGEEEEAPKNLLVLLEDATERMVLEQTLIQRVNEANLLSSALAASKEYIDKIITSMADALLVTTRTGKIKRVNPGAIALFGYSEEELIDRHISQIIADDKFLQMNQEYLLATSPQEAVKSVDVFCRTKAGNEITVAFSCSAIHADIEEFQEFVYVGRDITSRKRAEEEMRQALAKEKELNELKSRFVSMVSHEFGNPLNTAIVAAELLENYGDQTTEEEKRQYLRHIRSAARQMSQLLKDVLIVGKAEAGKIEFNPAPLDLLEFCENLVEQIKVAEDKKRPINFVYSGIINWYEEEELPLMDEQLLRHILTNLLSNAIKYSPKGGAVNLMLTCQDNEAIFQVKDEGIGIPPEDLKKLFETFHRARNVGKIPGTGLGLAIVKQSVDIHRGEISVTSEVGVGTTFTVTLPLHEE